MSPQKPCERCDNKTAHKHSGSHPAYREVPRTSPRAAPWLQFHHRYATKLPYHLYFRSGEERRPYSDRLLQTDHGGKGPHKACSAPDPQISQQRVQ